MTMTADPMAAVRAAKKSDDPLRLADLISVEALENIVRWHMNRDPSKVVSQIGGNYYLTVRLGSKDAKRCLFAVRLRPRHWEVRYGNLCPIKSGDQRKDHSRPGYSIQEFVSPDGKRYDVFGATGDVSDFKDLSSLAVNYCSPFQINSTKKTLTLKQIECNAEFTGLGPSNTVINLGDRWSLNVTQTEMCEFENFRTAQFLIDRERNTIVCGRDPLKDYGLFHRSRPARDWSDLGFTSDLTGYTAAVNAYYANDNAARESACALAFMLENLCQQIEGMSCEYIWPGHTYSKTWRRLFQGYEYTKEQSARWVNQGMCPTLGLLRSLRVEGRAVPPCILLTLPLYHARPACFENRDMTHGGEDFKQKPSKVKQILLMPVPSQKMSGTINPDLCSRNPHDVFVTRRCNFGGKCDYPNRGGCFSLDKATNPHSAVAFCMNSPQTELVHAYWGEASWVNTRDSALHEPKVYGWMADIDVLVTRIGAIVAEQFFANAS